MTAELNSEVRQEVKHHMGRRCFNWDYSSRCIYMITITLADRSQPILGRLVGEGEEWRVEPSEIGRIVEECWREIPAHWPGVEVICSQLMPEHFHGIIFVKEPQKKPLGSIIGSFKSKSSSRAGELLCRTRQGAELQATASAPSSAPARERAGIWAPGFVDLILFREGQLAKMIAYIRENPRRLGIKRAHPELFRVARDLVVDFAARGEAQNPARAKAQDAARGEGQGGVAACSEAQDGARGHFMAIGNHFLLDWPDIRQVQCSRSYFAYRRERLPGGGWKICRDSVGVPLVDFATPEFEVKAEAALAAAARGAVLISPCISHGEREIARRAFVAGYRVITLQNKGFSPLYKPGGKLFDTCAVGNLLMLAPINWPYVPGEKPITRDQAQVLNRIAQFIAGAGVVEINYKGAVMNGIEAAVAQATGARLENQSISRRRLSHDH
jgi:REP element-mobilizing transposase RayT